MLFSLQDLLSTFLVVSKSILTINIISYALIRKGTSTMLFPLQDLLVLFPFQGLIFPFQALLFPLQAVSKSMAKIYIIPYASIRYSSFMNLIGNTMPRAFITTILRHRSYHQYIDTRSLRRGNQGTTTLGRRFTAGRSVCLIP